MSSETLDAGAIIATVTDGNDLGRFLEEGIRNRFSALIDSFNANGTIAANRRKDALAQIESNLRNRLELERDLERYPGIMEEEIERPVFVVGNPRTGTTILQCLLAEDEAHRTLHYWQMTAPCPPPGIAPETVAARVAAESRNVEAMIEYIPGFLQAHPYLDLGGLSEAEDEDVFSIDFHCAFPQRYYRVPVLPIWTPPTDPNARFSFHKKYLQHMQYRQPKKRWICKGTSHQFDLPSLWGVYPDAICVWPHRDPATFIASLLELVLLIYRPVSGLQDSDFARTMLGYLKQGYDAVLSSEWIDDPRIVHIKFTDLMQDQVGTMKKLYGRIGADFSDRTEEKIRAFLDNPSNKSDRHGKFIYGLEKFGIKEGEIREMFSSYYEKFLL